MQFGYSKNNFTYRVSRILARKSREWYRSTWRRENEYFVTFRYANATYEERMNALYDDSVAFCISCVTLATIQFFFGALSVDLLNMSASSQISRVRKIFLRAVLRQDMTWYDTNTSTNFASRITE